MARFHLVQIDTVYLTDDGLITGKPCKTNVTGLGLFGVDKVGTTRPQASGRPRTQLALRKNAPIEVSIDFIHIDVYDEILERFQESLDDDTDFSLNISGIGTTLTITAVPDFPNHTKWGGEFSADTMKNVTFSFRTT
ncbi:MAG: hypothetical protein WBP82_00695 [Leuconostoc mesenteroides]